MSICSVRVQYLLCKIFGTVGHGREHVTSGVSQGNKNNILCIRIVTIVYE